jgi:hypothetical protein
VINKFNGWLLLALLSFLPACSHQPSEPKFSIKFYTTLNSRSIVKLAPNVFMVRDPLRFTLGGNLEPIVVPAGFIMDLASIPKVARAIEDRVDESMAPAILHDYLYWYQPCSRSEADAVMLLAMSSLNIGELKASVIYQAVRGFGGGAYEENRKRRQLQGEVRTLSGEGVAWIGDWQYFSSRKLETVLAEARAHKKLLENEVAAKDIKQTCSAILTACTGCIPDQ